MGKQYEWVKNPGCLKDTKNIWQKQPKRGSSIFIIHAMEKSKELELNVKELQPLSRGQQQDTLKVVEEEEKREGIWNHTQAEYGED